VEQHLTMSTRPHLSQKGYRRHQMGLDQSFGDLVCVNISDHSGLAKVRSSRKNESAMQFSEPGYHKVGVTTKNKCKTGTIN